VSTPPRSDPDAPGETDQPASPAEAPADREPFEFVERPRVKGEIYISRPALGRDPAKRDP
jgi:hypothetical protein